MWLMFVQDALCLASFFAAGIQGYPTSSFRCILLAVPVPHITPKEVKCLILSGIRTEAGWIATVMLVDSVSCWLAEH